MKLKLTVQPVDVNLSRGMSSLPFAQLQAFLAVARTGNFSAAARALQVSRSAVSQSVRQLEEQLQVVLVHRTTRSVALTAAGRRLVEGVAPAFAQTANTLVEVAAQPGEVTGTLRLTLPHAAFPLVLAPVLPTFRSRHPRVEVDVSLEDRLVDIVAGGFDAGIRLSESVQRDMVHLRLTEAFRFLVVGAPEYFVGRDRPRKPEDLLQHECITFRSPTTGALYAWELERGTKEWNVPVRGAVAVNDGLACAVLAKRGLGLAYVPEPNIREDLASGGLEVVLEGYAPTVPGYFIYYPSRAQCSKALRLFVEIAREVLLGA